jgi:uncharacterized membrane protein
MTSLIVALVVWSLIHFIPATAIDFRANLVRRLGPATYKAVFTLVTIGALLLLIHGWKAAPAHSVFSPPSWGAYAAIGLSLLASFCFFAPYVSNNLRRLVRHPQLAGVVLWAFGHLLANGEARSTVLFGGFAVWAILEMILLNRRDGVWIRPSPVPHSADVRLVMTGIGFFALILYSHLWLFGADPVAYL